MLSTASESGVGEGIDLLFMATEDALINAKDTVTAPC